MIVHNLNEKFDFAFGDIILVRTNWYYVFYYAITLVTNGFMLKFLLMLSIMIVHNCYVFSEINWLTK